ncbi:MAG TPA: CpsB/CapC family capsule biosynthesis tyrosine phosphatase [Gemmata sp.]|jgi:protein-tyrosine phosphatase|nr:CpsB/CapC family capsule biosynthesis tyrosine phosphatase [Gemmata sp.]
MIPLADTHVHLLAGLDDGPSCPEVALAMCRMLVSEGVRYATALAHQNEGYPDNTPDRLHAASSLLMSELTANNIPLSVYTTGEVMLSPTTFEDWQAGKLLTVGDRGKWLLVEMPHGECLNILPIADAFRPFGIQLIIAHAERYPELLDDPALTAQWIAAGCLIQVTAHTLAEPWDAAMEKALKRWATGGFIHLLGSDGHGIDRRLPVLAGGFDRLMKWVGRTAAERIGSEWGLAIFQGLPVEVPVPIPPTRSWFTRLFGG